MRLGAGWLTRPGVAAVMAALGPDAWFVGGAVRNALMNLPVADIDIATPLKPDEVTRRLENAGIKVIPTGIDHGTVTAVSGADTVEVTTFRADIETDGRHAVVRFGESLEEDAARRDFTMNALYADAAGEIVDPLGGLPDVHSRRVRFIGDADRRIREDYLRILRFFRFHAVYGGEEIDAEGLAACAALADGIDGLARERIGAEMRKLLGAADPAPAVASMAATGVLARALPGADPRLLAPVVHLEGRTGAIPDWRTRLAALGGADPVGALRLSRAEARFLEDVAALLAKPVPPAVAAWTRGADAARAAALIGAAISGAIPDGLEAALARGTTAEMPLTAADLIGQGMAEGPALGRAMKRAEAAWLASDFSLDKAALLRHALDKGQ